MNSAIVPAHRGCFRYAPELLHKNSPAQSKGVTSWHGYSNQICAGLFEKSNESFKHIGCQSPNARLGIWKLADSFESFIRSLRNWDELAAEQEAAKNKT